MTAMHDPARLRVTATPLAGVAVVVRLVHEDARGSFARVFCAAELAAAGIDATVAQANHSHTRRRGSVRGMHFQHPPHTDAKLVTCLRGEVFDVAVDLRRGSPTFLRWHAEHLSAANRRALYIGRGFAHGFQTLSDDCDLLYLHTAPHAPGSEGGIDPRDAALAIPWPLPFADLSERDASFAPLGASFAGLDLSPQ